MDIKRKDIWMAEVDDLGKRPVIIMHNENTIKYFRKIYVMPLTTNIRKDPMSGNFDINILKEDGKKIANNIIINEFRTLDKRNLLERIGNIDEVLYKSIITNILIMLGIWSEDDLVELSENILGKRILGVNESERLEDIYNMQMEIKKAIDSSGSIGSRLLDSFIGIGMDKTFLSILSYFSRPF